jgi:mannose-6-phosphate isomerase-like protein (cupin superfamily)
MQAADQTLDMTPIGVVFHIRKTSQESNGKIFEMEWELLPEAGGTPVHIHPLAVETYKVLEGKLEVNVNGKWKTLGKGQELTVGKGVPHTFRNPTDTLTRVYNSHAPAMQFEAYFKDLRDIVAKLSSGKKEKLKMNLNAVIHLSMLMKKYPAEIRSVNPPDFVVSMMNGMGKLRGIKL